MYYLGIDVGSVSTDLVIMDESLRICDQLYLRTGGRPADTVLSGLRNLSQQWEDSQINGVGATGSGRSLAGILAGADVVKNEITTHGTAAATADPEVRTVLEIGGQDSKIILLERGLITDFAMNTVCAAGTGSFLDRQAERMGIGVEQMGEYACRAKAPLRIAGRCAVFAESDLIHKQQIGCTMEDLIAGLSEALVRNYLSNVAKGKKMEPKICFQGGVAANQGIRRAFEKELGMPIFVPEQHKVMGAWGAAILAKNHAEATGRATAFKGFLQAQMEITSKSFRCADCENHCEVTVLQGDGRPLGCFSDRCGKYQNNKQIVYFR